MGDIRRRSASFPAVPPAAGRLLPVIGSRSGRRPAGLGSDALPVLCHAPVALSKRSRSAASRTGQCGNLAPADAQPLRRLPRPAGTAPASSQRRHSTPPCAGARAIIHPLSDAAALPRHVVALAAVDCAPDPTRRPPDVRLRNTTAALLRLMHLRVPCAAPVLRRRRRVDEARVNSSPCAADGRATPVQHCAACPRPSQAVLRAPEVQDGGRPVRQPQPHETPPDSTS